MIVRMNIVLNRTVVVDSDCYFDSLCGSHASSQSKSVASRTNTVKVFIANNITA